MLEYDIPLTITACMFIVCFFGTICFFKWCNYNIAKNKKNSYSKENKNNSSKIVNRYQRDLSGLDHYWSSIADETKKLPKVEGQKNND